MVTAETISLNRFQIYLNFGISAYHLEKKSESLTILLKAKLILNDMHAFELFYYIGLIYFEKSDYLEASSVLQIAHEQLPSDRGSGH